MKTLLRALSVKRSVAVHVVKYFFGLEEQINGLKFSDSLGDLVNITMNELVKMKYIAV
jgi:hypothetical protein